MTRILFGSVRLILETNRIHIPVQMLLALSLTPTELSVKHSEAKL